MTLIQRLIRLFFSNFSPLFPRLTGKLAFELFQHPHAKKTRSRELALYQQFQEKRLSHPEEDIIFYEKGEKNAYPLILVHGWESNPGSLYALAEALYDHGFWVKVLNLPAHGKSHLKKTNMVEAGAYIQSFLEAEGHQKGFSMLCHSFGSAASSIALMETGYQADDLVFLTTPDKVLDIFSDFRAMIQIKERAYQDLIHRVEEMIPYSLEAFNISDFLQAVSFDRLYVLHDKKDKVLPFHNARAVKEKIPQCQLIPLEGKGHYRMLWDEEVIEKVLTIFNDRLNQSVLKN
jgi:pimeloyl-ACP methyl ester carboxylesterase